MELFVGGLWGSFFDSWRLLGTLLGGLGGSLGTFLGIWAAPSGHFFWSWRLLGGPYGTKWLPELTFLDFGCVLGSIWGGFWGPGWGLGGHLGAFWRPLGGLRVFFFVFFLGKCKTMKSVVLLL